MNSADIQTETAEQVIAHAANAGFTVSRHQLERWQGNGLIPRPHQKGLGQGRGTQTLYPEGTAQHVLTLCHISEQHRSLERRGWELWWQGFSVEERYWRPMLQLVAEMFDRRKVDLLNPDDAVSDQITDVIGGFSTARMNSRLLRQMRKRVGASNFPTLVQFATQTAAGDFRSVSTTGDDRADELEILEKGLGTQGDYESVFALISSAIPDSFQFAISSVSDNDIFRLRDFLNGTMNSMHNSKNCETSESEENMLENQIFGLFFDADPEHRAALLVAFISLKNPILSII